MKKILGEEIHPRSSSLFLFSVILSLSLSLPFAMGCLHTRGSKEGSKYQEEENNEAPKTYSWWDNRVLRKRRVLENLLLVFIFIFCFSFGLICYGKYGLWCIFLMIWYMIYIFLLHPCYNEFGCVCTGHFLEMKYDCY